MNTRPDSERQRMLEVLDARWAVGRATKKRSTFSLKLAAMAASGALALAVMAPGNVAYADEGAQADDAAQPDAAALVADDEADEAEEADADAAEAAEEPEEAVAEAAEPEADAAAAVEPEAAAADEPLAIDAAEAEPALASAPAAASPSAEAKASAPAAAPTLKDLIDALADGGTLTLDDDMDYDAGSNGTINIKKAVTIDLAGHALSYSGDELFSVSKAGSVLLKGGSLSGDSYLAEYNSGALSLSGMDVEGLSDYLVYQNTGSVGISDSTVDTDYDLVEYNYGGDVSISGSAIATTDYVVYENDGGTVAISDTDIDSDTYLVSYNKGGDVSITGGTIECSEVVDDNYGTLTLDGAEVSCGYAVCCNYGDVTVKSTSGAGIVCDDYLVSSNYEGASVTIESCDFTSDGDLISDNYGDVTILDGTFDCGDTIIDETYESGTVTVKGGTFKSGGYGFDDTHGTIEISNADVTSGSDCIYLSGDAARATIDGGSFTSTDGECVDVNDGTADILGGTFTAYDECIEADDDSAVVNIGGGTYTSTDGYCIYNDGTVNISGGTFESAYDACVENYGTMNLSGGTFESTATGGLAIDDGGTVNVLDGYYADPTDWKETKASKVVICAEKMCTVTFDDNGTTSTEQVKGGTKIGTLSGLDRKDTGDGFIAWLLDGVVVDETSGTGVNEDVTIVAYYKKSAEDIVVTLDDNGTKRVVSMPAGTTFAEFFADNPELARAMGTAAGDFYGWMIDEFDAYNEAGDDCPAFGTRVDSESPMEIRDDITLKAEYITSLAKVSTFEELQNAIADKVEFIELTSLIEVTDEISGKYDCTIFSRDASSCGLVRSEGFTGSLVSWYGGGYPYGDYPWRDSLTLDNILVDGKGYEAKDAAVFVGGWDRLYLTKTTIQNNNNTDGDAGGVYAGKGLLSISECKISNNSASSNGGGVYVSNSGITVLASRITDNHADVDGGGIYWEHYSGGSSYVPLNHSDASIVESVIDGNTAGEDGGAVCHKGGKSGDIPIDVLDSEITNNKADENGGAFYVEKATLSLKGDTEIAYNTAGENGGGIVVSGYPSRYYPDTMIPGYADQYDGSIHDNHADGEGGGVYLQDDANVDLDGGMVYDNTADVAGDDIGSDGDSNCIVYSTQPDRNLGDGSSASLGTVTVKQIDGYHEADADDGISVPWGDWYLDPDTERYSGTDGETMPVDGEHTTVDDSEYPALKAIWTGLLLAYDANFGDDPAYQFDAQAYKQSQTASVADYADLGKLPERAGYTFLGWNTKADGTGAAYDPDSGFLMTDSAVLYAMWACQVAYDVQPDEVYGAPEDYVVPTDDAEYAEGSTVRVADLLSTGQGTAQHPDGRTIPGTWTFVGERTDGTPVPADWACADWADGDIASIDRSTVIAGHWEFAPDTYKVAYEVLADAVYGAPDDSVVPADKNAYIFHDSVKVAADLVSVQGWAMLDGQKVLGEWIFSAWDKAGSFLIDGDTLISGSWTFVPQAAPDPEPDPTPDPEPMPSADKAVYSVQDTAEAASPKTADSQTAIPAAAAIALGACAMALEALRRRKRGM